MFPRAARLRLQRDIKAVQRMGRGTGNRFFFIKMLSTNLPRSRATVVVSQKVAKKAVDRNRIKRQVRAVLSPAVKKISKAHDLLVIVRKPALELTTPEIGARLTSLLKELL